MTRKIVFLLFLCFFAHSVFASRAALLFLLISPSPQANAMGETYGNIVEEDPMVMVMNPASLGLLAQSHYVSTAFLSPKVQWLPGIASDLNYSCHSTGIGINLKSITRLPLFYGLGIYHVGLDLGTQAIFPTTDLDEPQYFKSWDKATGISMALGFKDALKASIGFTVKTIASNLAPGYKTETHAIDVGLLLKAPMGELSQRFEILKEKSFWGFWPEITPGFYYSLTNIGGRVSYITASQKDPLPRTVSMGVNIEASLKYSLKKQWLDVFS